MMTTKAFLTFLAMALAVVTLSLSALFQPTFVEPLIERINELSTSGMESGPGPDSCADCGEDPGPTFHPEEGAEPGPGLEESCVDCGAEPPPGVPVEVDPAFDADGYIGTIWEDGGREVVVYTPSSRERAESLAQRVHYGVDTMLDDEEWIDVA